MRSPPNNRMSRMLVLEITTMITIRFLERPILVRFHKLNDHLFRQHPDPEMFHLQPTTFLRIFQAGALVYDIAKSVLHLVKAMVDTILGMRIESEDEVCHPFVEV